MDLPAGKRHSPFIRFFHTLTKHECYPPLRCRAATDGGIPPEQEAYWYCQYWYCQYALCAYTKSGVLVLSIRPLCRTEQEQKM